MANRGRRSVLPSSDFWRPGHRLHPGSDAQGSAKVGSRRNDVRRGCHGRHRNARRQCRAVCRCRRTRSVEFGGLALDDPEARVCRRVGHAGYAAGVTFNPLEELTLQQLQLRTSMKWRAHPDDVLPLWVAEMDVKLPPTVADALRTAIDLGDTGYPSGTALAEAVGEFASRRWQWHDLEVARTTIVPDVMLGIVETLRLVTGEDDAVTVNPPVYAPFYAFVSHAGRRVIEAPLDAEGRISLDALEEAFTRGRASGRKAAYLLCNPHNPTGTVHTVDE